MLSCLSGSERLVATDEPPERVARLAEEAGLRCPGCDGAVHLGLPVELEQPMSVTTIV